MTLARGPQVLLDGAAALAARGGAGRTMRENVDAMELLLAAGVVGDGNSVDGSSRTGVPPEDVFLGSPQQITLPPGTTAERPSTGDIGQMRWNTTLGQLEFGSGGSWSGLLTDASGLSKVLLTSQSVAGPVVFNGAMSLGAGGSGNATLTQSGTGNFLVTLGGASSNMDFRTSTGTVMLRLGAAAQIISARKPLQLTGPYTITGAPGTDAAIFMNNTWTGTSSGVSQVNYMQLLQATDNVAVTGLGGVLIGLGVKMTGSGASVLGNRQAGLFTYVLSSTPASPTFPGNTYSALNTKVDLMVPSGGTTITSDLTSTGLHNCFGFNSVAHIGPLATNYRQIVGNEADVWNEAGSTVGDRIGFTIGLIAGSKGTVTRDDVAIAIVGGGPPDDAGADGVNPWRVGYAIGRSGAYPPLGAGSTIMKTIPRQSDPNVTIDAGLDFTQGYNFVNFSIAVPGFSVNGSGTPSFPAPVTKTTSFTMAAGEATVICNGGGTITVTLPAAASFPGQVRTIKTIAAQTVVSASSNVVPLAGGAAGTAILAATAGKWATLQSDGTNWVITSGN